MALQGSGNQISLSDIQNEFGGVISISLSEYYRNSGYVTANNTSVPTSGEISMSDFYSTVKTTTVTYEIIGGGGGGAGARDFYGANYANAGGNGGASSISGSGVTTITANGGTGGAIYTSSVGLAGASTAYGSGGQGGLNSDYGNYTNGYPPSSSAYGAGGGSGGTYFATAQTGNGGGAGTRLTGTFEIVPNTVLTITIGGYGNGGYGGLTSGARGTSGYARITVGNYVQEYTSSGTYTVPDL